jgi:hypothetical protein
LLAETSRAAFVIVRSGRRARPATSHPSQIESTVMIASAMPDWMRSWWSAAFDCACAAAITSSGDGTPTAPLSTVLAGTVTRLTLRPPALPLEMKRLLVYCRFTRK